jgi:integrase/recombinase XerD
VTIERGLSANTVASYRRDLERYLAWCDGRGIVDVDDVTENGIADFAASLRQGSDGHPALAASSASRAVVSVRSMHRFAAKEGVARTDPSKHVRPTAIPRRLPKALPYADVKAIIDGAGDDETPQGLRDRALVEFLYGTGARVSEAVDLDVDDVDLETMTVVVTGKGSKQRLLPLGEFAAPSRAGAGGHPGCSSTAWADPFPGRAPMRWFRRRRGRPA